MAISIFQSDVLSGLFGDEEIASCLNDASDARYMVRFEQALAEVQGELGIIPREAADRISNHLPSADMDLAALRAGTATSGVPTIALVAELRKGLPEEIGQWIHWGATSQDVIDTAHVLQWRDCLQILEMRLASVIDNLQSKSKTHSDRMMAGRTRSQIATPITFGYRVAQWAHPLIEAENALPALKSTVLKVQFGGAAGTISALGPDGTAVADGLAANLGLAPSPSWHVNRTSVLALAGWLGQVISGLAKMAGDLVVLGRSEIGEAIAGSSGGSSTMPQKANPVQAETIQALAGLAVTFQSGISMAASQLEERDGARWPVEWALFPQLFVAAGAALGHAQGLAETLRPNNHRLDETLTSNPAIMAEAATFLLAKHMLRSEAQAVVKAAIARGGPFADALRHETQIDIDWATALEPASAAGPSQEMAERIFAHRNKSAS